MVPCIRLEAIASRLEAIASRLEAIARRLEAIARRLEAIAAIASALEAIAAIASTLEAIATIYNIDAIWVEAISIRFLAVRSCVQDPRPKDEKNWGERKKQSVVYTESWIGWVECGDCLRFLNLDLGMGCRRKRLQKPLHGKSAGGVSGQLLQAPGPHANVY